MCSAVISLLLKLKNIPGHTAKYWSQFRALGGSVAVFVKNCFAVCIENLYYTQAI